MKYTWNLAKATSNRVKHRVDFADAIAAIEDRIVSKCRTTGSIMMKIAFRSSERPRVEFSSS